MNWFQWLTVVAMTCLLIYAIVKFMTRRNNKVCAQCRRSQPLANVNWTDTALDSPTLEREKDSDDDEEVEEAEAAAGPKEEQQQQPEEK